MVRRFKLGSMIIALIMVVGVFSPIKQALAEGEISSLDTNMPVNIETATIVSVVASPLRLTDTTLDAEALEVSDEILFSLGVDDFVWENDTPHALTADILSFNGISVGYSIHDGADLLGEIDFSDEDTIDNIHLRLNQPDKEDVSEFEFTIFLLHNGNPIYETAIVCKGYVMAINDTSLMMADISLFSEQIIEGFLAPISAPIENSVPISNRADLEAIAHNLSGNYHLTQNIDLFDAEWIPIGDSDNPFSGTFDGQGYVIKNLTITGDYSYCGLFGYAADASIRNVGLEDININIDKSNVYLSNVYVGGICGRLRSNSVISNCYSVGDVYASANGSSYAGGVCGSALGSGIVISNCYNAGNVSTYSFTDFFTGGICGSFDGSGEIRNCYNLGDVSAASTTANAYVGGICGIYDADIALGYCYNSGSIYGRDAGGICGYLYTNAVISNCYNTGTITGNVNGGGICGYLYSNAIISNCYNTGLVTGIGHLGGICGTNRATLGIINNSYCIDLYESSHGTQLTATQMKDKSSYVGWDFDNVWGISTSINNGYPYLMVQSQDSGNPEDTDDDCPIIVIPGIAGSTLINDSGETYWFSFSKVSNLAMNEYGSSVQNDIRVKKSDFGTRSPIESMDTYEKMIKYLVENTNKEVYFWAYDWRVDNALTAAVLAEFIDTLSATNVDIVAHSMGGLVASRYIADGNAGKVRKLISIGTPYLGSPKVPYVFSTGGLIEFALPGWLDFPGNWDTVKVAGNDLRKVATHMPSVYQLLPYDRTSYATAGFTSIKDDELLKYVYMYNVEGALISTATKQRFIENARNFAGSLFVSNKHAIELVDSYVLTGRNIETINKVMYGSGVIQNGQLSHVSDYISNMEFTNDGDETVPYWSASGNGRFKTYDYEADHTGLVSDNTVLADIIEILIGNTIPNRSVTLKPYTIIKAACPVNVTVTNGSESLTNTSGMEKVRASFGSLYFTGENESIKTFVLDANENYDIKIYGYDDGVMDYTIEFYDKNDNLLAASSFDDVPITSNTIIHTNNNGSGDIALRIDANGDGITDYTIPNSVKREGNYNNDSYEAQQGFRQFIDTATGISVSGNFSYDAVLNIEKDAMHGIEYSCKTCYSISGYSESQDLLAVYALNASGMYSNGVTVTIPIDEQYNGQVLTVLTCINGTLEATQLTVADGKITGTFSRLPIIAIMKPDGDSIMSLRYRVLARRLNVRLDPSLNSTVIGQLSMNDIVVSSEQTEDGWAKVTLADGRTGWSSMRYLVLFQGSTKTGTLSTTANLNMRSGAGTQFGSLGILPKGTVVEVTDYDGVWAITTINGREVYLHSGYLR